jgi:hypothetical protein
MSRAPLHIVLPFIGREREFLDNLLDSGEIKAELLTEDADTRHRINNNPGLLWKAHNVRAHHRM